ncbi:hypothetical protein WA158_005023 [Blastocystis sp. Blastoise]
MIKSKEKKDKDSALNILKVSGWVIVILTIGFFMFFMAVTPPNKHFDQNDILQWVAGLLFRWLFGVLIFIAVFNLLCSMCVRKVPCCGILDFVVLCFTLILGIISVFTISNSLWYLEDFDTSHHSPTQDNIIELIHSNLIKFFNSTQEVEYYNNLQESCHCCGFMDRNDDMGINTPYESEACIDKNAGPCLPKVVSTVRTIANSTRDIIIAICVICVYVICILSWTISVFIRDIERPIIVYDAQSLMSDEGSFDFDLENMPKQFVYVYPPSVQRRSKKKSDLTISN